MPDQRQMADPYRTLGIPRDADPDEVKTAHRRLAKRFHPDGTMGDEQRFLAVQEAYQLLSDPLRRREWDRRHAPGPLSARDVPAGAAATRPRPAAASPAGGSRVPGATAVPPRDRRGFTRATRPQPAPGTRTTTWSAEHVPWWTEFRPRSARHDEAVDSERTAVPTGGPAHEATAPAMDFDVFSRSSGAAWSMAARRHFRKGDEDLPSRGAWRYRGTQVVTGAEARKVAAEEAAEQAARDAAAKSPPGPEEPSPR
jgi:curved DNA-binding protein CbpA